MLDNNLEVTNDQSTYCLQETFQRWARGPQGRKLQVDTFDDYEGLNYPHWNFQAFFIIKNNIVKITSNNSRSFDFLSEVLLHIYSCCMLIAVHMFQRLFLWHVWAPFPY